MPKLVTGSINMLKIFRTPQGVCTYSWASAKKKKRRVTFQNNPFVLYSAEAWVTFLFCNFKDLRCGTGYGWIPTWFSAPIFMSYQHLSPGLCNSFGEYNDTFFILRSKKHNTVIFGMTNVLRSAPTIIANRSMVQMGVFTFKTFPEWVRETDNLLKL